MNKRNLLILFFTILIVFIGYKIYIYRTYLDSIDEVTRINTLAKETASKTIDSLNHEWSIHENTDEMTDKTTKLASIMSHNTVNFDFPYNGGSRLSMHIREKENNVDVYFTINNGQFVCNEYMGTDEIVMRFGNEDAITYKTCESATGDSNYLFIRYTKDAKQIINKCKIAKEIKVKAPFFQEGSRVFTFNINTPLSL